MEVRPDPPPISERIQLVRKENEALKASIRTNRDRMRDTTLKAEAKDLAPLRLDRLRCRRTLVGHLGKVYSIQWAPDSQHLVSASQDGKILVWDALSGNKTRAIPLRSTWVMTCSMAPSMRMVACGGLENVCTVYDLSSRNESGVAGAQVLRELTAHTGYLSSCRFVTDHELLTASGDMTAAHWDVQSGTRIAELRGHLGDVMSVVPSPTDPALALTGSCDATARMWDLRCAECVSTFSGHDSDVNAVQWAPSGLVFATASDDASLRLWDVRADRELASYSDNSIISTATSVSFSRSGRVLFGGYASYQCIAWDTLRGERVSILEGHSNTVSCVDVTRDGLALATASWDNTIKVWA
eukprot:m51a1_g1675 hypothetical protein (356) ;mRNA; f:396222-397722